MNNIAVGFQDHVNAITERFQESYVWSDKDKSRVAMFVTDALAGISETNQAYTAFALREAFIQKARRSTSVLAGSRFLGVQLNRKMGATVSVNLRNNDTETKSIMARTKFTIGSDDFYIIENVIIPAKETRLVSMRQGTINTKSFDLNSINLDFPVIKLSEPDFVVSLNDMIVYAQDKSTMLKTFYSRLDDSLFERNTPDRIFIDETSAEGDCTLIFGNGVFGARLDKKSNLVVEYITTKGALGNSGQIGLRVNSPDSFLAGITTTEISGGDNEQDVNVLKLYAGYIFESRKSWVRPDHWKANIMNYPDVADVVIQSQRDIDPEDPMWMNVVRICVLPKNSSNWGGANPNPRSAQWTRFLSWAREHILDNIELVPCNPEKILTDIVVHVYIHENESRSSWESITQNAILESFKRSKGTLGRMIDPSDLHDLCTLDSEGKRYAGIDYVRILSPTTTVKPSSSLEYVSPRNITVQVKYSDRKEK